MKDITLSEIQAITSEATRSEPFGKKRFPYLESYKALNEAIIEKAKKVENSIRFDFTEDAPVPSNSIQDLKAYGGRIYLSLEGGQAEYDVYDYPSYLISRGFKV